MTSKSCTVRSNTNNVKGQFLCNTSNSDGVTKENGNMGAQRKGKIVLLSDSHGRFLSPKLLDWCSNLFEVTGTVKPNGRFMHVIEEFKNTTEKFTKMMH